MLHLNTEAIIIIEMIVAVFIIALILLACCMMDEAQRRRCCCCRTADGERRGFASLNELLFEVDDEETGVLQEGEETREISVEAFFTDILSSKVVAVEEEPSESLQEPLL